MTQDPVTYTPCGTELPFSLTCSGGCDAEVYTVDEAARLEWKRIQKDAGGSSWNYIGVCPACAREVLGKHWRRTKFWIAS